MFLLKFNHTLLSRGLVAIISDPVYILSPSLNICQSTIHFYPRNYWLKCLLEASREMVSMRSLTNSFLEKSEKIMLYTG